MSRQILGLDPSKVLGSSETPEHILGAIAYDRDGKAYMYCKAGGAIADKTPCSLATGFVATESGNGGVIDGVSVAGEAIASNEHFWMQVEGEVENANVAAGVTAGMLLAVKADANGDFAQISATSATDGAHAIRAKAFAAEAAGLADVLLY